MIKDEKLLDEEVLKRISGGVEPEPDDEPTTAYTGGTPNDIKTNPGGNPYVPFDPSNSKL